MTEQQRDTGSLGGRRTIRATAPLLDTAFAEAALTLSALVVDPKTVPRHGAVHFVCGSRDPVALFRCWIEAVRGEMLNRGVVFCDFQVHLRNGSLAAVGFGAVAGEDLRPSLRAVAAATISDVAVTTDHTDWSVECHIDLAAGTGTKEGCQTALAAGRD